MGFNSSDATGTPLTKLTTWVTSWPDGSGLAVNVILVGWQTFGCLMESIRQVDVPPRTSESVVHWTVKVGVSTQSAGMVCDSVLL